MQDTLINKQTTKLCFLSLDLFGKSLIFEENNEQKFSTTIGSILTVLMFIALIVMSFMFGQDIYKRENPNIMLSEFIVGNELAYTNQKENPLIIFFMDENAQLLKDDPNSLFTIRTSFIYLDEHTTPNMTYYYGINKCNPDNYIGKANKDFVKSKVSLFPTYCIDHNMDFMLRSSQNQPNSYSIVVDIMKCDEEYRENNFYYDDFNGEDSISLNYSLTNITYKKNNFMSVKCKYSQSITKNFFFSLST